MSRQAYDPRLDAGADDRFESFDEALGQLLDAQAGDAVEIELSVKADGGDEWEVQLWLNGDDAGLWKITDSDQERITE